MATKTKGRERLVKRLLDEHGRTFAQECGIRVDDTPAPLFQLLVMSMLMSARIGAAQAVEGMRGLLDAGWTTPEKMADTTWRERTDVLNRNGYARYDERTSRMLEDLVGLLQDEYGGDLRRLHERADGDVGELCRLLEQFKGIGPTGASIFLREVQGVWSDVRPFVDDRARTAAKRLDLPADHGELAALVPGGDLPRLVAALVRVELDDAYDELQEPAGGD